MSIPTIPFCLLLSSFSAPAYAWSESAGIPGPAVTLAFEENKGQVRTTNGDPAPFVRYCLSQRDADIFLLSSGIAYQFSRTHYPEGYTALARKAAQDPAEFGELEALRKDIRTETYRMDMLLEGANPAPRITTNGRSSDYTHYYNRDVLDVHTYTTITYHDVWPGIDWVVYTKESGMKYDFIVRPGADPAQVQLRFSDHEELYVDAKGELVHGNRMGRFTEAKPVSFQEGKAIATRFVLEGDLLRFAVDAYDASKTLTIDPERVWGTYYGGSSGELNGHCSTDHEGNVYITGQTPSTNAIASGGHQNTYGGGANDAYFVKFNAAGTRLWGTYYGGSGGDGGASSVSEADGNVYLAGTTGSTGGISSGGHQNTSGGGQSDAFLVKFNADGTRIWATYYGGAGYDAAVDCAVDGSGNVYLAGTTLSTTGIADGGHQNTHGGGERDAFLVKFSPDGLRLWATYLGGSGTENAHGCAVDVAGNVFLCGSTYSTSDIASNGHQNALAGTDDAFLVKFDAAGTRLWGTYYGGSDSDWGADCATDADGNVFLTGDTYSLSGMASGGHQNAFGGGQDAYLVKFDNAGVRLWATYYGGSQWDGGLSCATDASGNVFMSGYTESQSGMASGGHQNTYGGGYEDAYLVKFNAAGVRQWATYYGGTGEDGWGHCAVGPDGSVYLHGYTTSTNGIASNGHQNTPGGSDEDTFLVKFAGDGGTTGLPEEVMAAELSFQPNPTQGLFAITYPYHAAPRHLAVHDATGRLVMEQGIASTTGRITMDLSDQGPGVYVVELRFADGSRAQGRMVKE